MDWNHIHLATNHLPVVGSLFCLIFWVLTLVRRDSGGQRMVLWVIVFTSLVGIGVKFTGEPAAEQIKVSPEILKAHEDWADRATTAIFFWFVASSIGLWKSRVNKRMPVYVVALVTFFGLATLGLMAVAANYGGKIGHPELRTSSVIVHPCPRIEYVSPFV